MNFWDKRTELEKTLLLILCVTIPVNGVLIYMYSYFMRYYPKNGDLENPLDFGPLTGLKPQTLIGSISRKSADNKYEFRCPAILISSNWILTSIECMKTGDEVRISSEFWFKGGYKRQIVKTQSNKLLNFRVGKMDEPVIIDDKETSMVMLTTEDHASDKKKQFDTYRWNATFTDNDDDAEKYNKIYKLRFNETTCSREHEGFCALENKADLMLDPHWKERRGPVFTMDTYELIALEVYRKESKDEINVELFYTPLKRNDLKKYLDRN